VRRLPTLEITSRPNARDAALVRTDRIWYRQAIRGGYGHAWLVPGLFERYANIRCLVTLADRSGGFHRVFVNASNVFPRRFDEEASDDV